jgi:lipoate-protein ligase A
VSAGSPAWTTVTVTGTVADLHGRDPVPGTGRLVELMRPTGPALVLGSAQRDDVIDAAAVAARGLAVARRRSGGGAVLVDPASCCWLDLVVPRGDPLWDDDVVRSFGWVGEAWAAGLRSLGVAAAVAPAPRPADAASRLVCFAGLGAGEVLVEGRKAVGLSQRRTRGHARYQCLANTGGSAPGAVLDLLAVPGGADRDSLRAALAAGATAVAVDAGALAAAVVAHLPGRS